MEEKRHWLQMPDEIMGGMILRRLGAIDILMNAQKVCRDWRRICKDPAMWKMIDMDYYSSFWYKKKDLEKLCKQAVHRSCGELIDIRLNYFVTDDLLKFISGCSSKLNCLCLTRCHGVTGFGLSNALKRLPHLETLELSYIRICAEDIEVIGHNCPQLKSFTMDKLFPDDHAHAHAHAHAIANSMPALLHLKLGCSKMHTDDGIRAILNGCPHLESLDLRGCYYLHLTGNLEKLCKEQIKDFKYNHNNIPGSDEDSDMDYI
ncbi:hypothetical protein OSB04_001660 [Centaurea solstitialis]|uniref:F-box domain-containing protein n=1 Tax=Centaurea solstitialis TaxID=347529 RepID=A0AA38TRR8_9ASTR|nr:hypothetical protein OSB04_001660 [Centaurea solstitialis]